MIRFMMGYSQGELARRAGLSPSTVYHVERGEPISERSLVKLGRAMDIPVENLQIRDMSQFGSVADCMVSRHDVALWTVAKERRVRVTFDDISRIQDPQERQRLGGLGLVSAFVSGTSFIMPEGPGMIFFELYDHFEEAFNDAVYRDCTITCNRGRVRIRIGETTVELGEGDVVGYRSKDLEWMEPIEGEERPVRLTWTGAVRIGSPIREIGKGERVKRRRRDP